MPTYYIVAPAEASSNLSRFDGIRFGYRSGDAGTLEELYTRTRAEGFGPEVKRRIMTGTYVLSAGYYDAYYLQAQKVRQLIAADFAAAFENVDLVAGPTTPTPAFRLGDKVDDPVQMYLNDIYTIGVNLAGLPGISVPCGLADGLPVGLQLIGPHFGDAAVLHAAHRFQQATDFHLAAPGSVMMAWETVIGLEIHAQLSHAQQDLFRFAYSLWRRAEYAGEPGRPRLPGRVAGTERRGRAPRCEVRARGRRKRIAAFGLCTQELLLPGPAEGLPDQPVRAADRARRRTGDPPGSRTAVRR